MRVTRMFNSQIHDVGGNPARSAIGGLPSRLRVIHLIWRRVSKTGWQDLFSIGLLPPSKEVWCWLLADAETPRCRFLEMKKHFDLIGNIEYNIRGKRMLGTCWGNQEFAVFLRTFEVVPRDIGLLFPLDIDIRCVLNSKATFFLWCTAQVKTCDPIFMYIKSHRIYQQTIFLHFQSTVFFCYLSSVRHYYTALLPVVFDTTHTGRPKALAALLQSPNRFTLSGPRLNLSQFGFRLDRT